MKEKKEWFQSIELIGLDGMPRTTQGVTLKAKNEHWVKRKAEGVKGRAFEYWIQSLPEETQKQLARKCDNVRTEDDKDHSNRGIKPDEWTTNLIQIPNYEANRTANAQYSIGIHPQILINEGILPTGLFTMKVKGNSMEPTLSDGDIVVVTPAQPPLLVLEGIFVIRIGKDMLIKRIQFNTFDRLLQVDSDNSLYRNYTIRDEDLNQVEIIGEVVLALGKIKTFSQTGQTNDESENSVAGV